MALTMVESRVIVASQPIEGQIMVRQIAELLAMQEKRFSEEREKSTRAFFEAMQKRDSHIFALTEEIKQMRTTHEASATQFQSSIGTLQARVASVENENTALKSSLTTAQQLVDTARNENQNNHRAIVNCNNGIAELHIRINAIYQQEQGQISALATSVAGLATSLAGLGAGVGNLQAMQKKYSLN